ncbi:hypothetical protein CANCADRAFT_75557 [Tortispora caseinolytica NRRL Y-17796]|uniref:Uncharacterized protein n=1 Tax=Tortispora caseinolytica NRRL Y-17796 TaxID=767744 RepID=A0A1E4TJ45_9ASCO|nr:hypothetical protein CANCADRAFT_75557 [Tortispora caseinolytica NRRL Y-17796]
MGKLDGKVAVVTGGGSGFGLGIVKKFLEEGAKVVVVDLNEEAGTKVAEEFGVKFVQANVALAESWKTVLQTSIDTYGKLDVVVNNAGTTYRNKPTLEVTEEDFDKVFTVNVKSVFHSFNTIIPYFKEHGGGSFIQISSTAAIRPRPRLTWYNATKGAVSIASKSMAVEHGPDNIRFNCICPVAGWTGMIELFLGVPATPENREKFQSTIPIGRFSEPSDIANATAFLASDEAAFITGVDLEVDGGRCV